MALIVGGTTVTGTQTLDATKLTGNLPSLNGSSLTSLNGSNISSGTVAEARVASLSASKIGSGTLADARIPSLAASKITSGSFGTDRIPNFNATKITSGTFGSDRIPNFNATKITSGTMNGARISGGTFGSVNGSNISGLPSPSSIPVTSYQAVGQYVMMKHDNQGTFHPGSTYSNLKVSGGDNSQSNSYSLSGTYRSFSRVTSQYTHGLGQRIS